MIPEKIMKIRHWPPEPVYKNRLMHSVFSLKSRQVFVRDKIQTGKQNGQETGALTGFQIEQVATADPALSETCFMFF